MRWNNRRHKDDIGPTKPTYGKTRLEDKMTAEDDAGGKDSFQNPLTYEGGADDSHECADEKVRILQPDGQPVPRWRDKRT
jgi:hypothetical protein